MSYETIDLAVERSGIAIIHLNRPDRLNAFNRTMMEELLSACDVIDGDDAVRAAIVTGTGRAFCAGADLDTGGDTFDAEVRGRDPGIINRDGGGLVALRFFQLTKPVIAAINGPAVGVGITMTLSMDVRLAVPEAKIGFVFARRGIVPEACSSWFLPRLVGISQAAQWCYSGRVFPATEAARAGLLVTVEDGEDVVDRAHRLAEELTEHSAPVSVALTRQMLWRGMTLDHPMEAHRADSRAIQALGSLADAREGVESFLEKREPKWSLRPSRDTPDVFPDWDEPDFR
jgi:enoyl-CoA hydratase/carnithine racemase